MRIIIDAMGSNNALKEILICIVLSVIKEHGSSDTIAFENTVFQAM